MQRVWHCPWAWSRPVAPRCALPRSTRTALAAALLAVLLVASIAAAAAEVEEGCGSGCECGAAGVAQGCEEAPSADGDESEVGLLQLKTRRPPPSGAAARQGAPLPTALQRAAPPPQRAPLQRREARSGQGHEAEEGVLLQLQTWHGAASRLRAVINGSEATEVVVELERLLEEGLHRRNATLLAGIIIGAVPMAVLAICCGIRGAVQPSLRFLREKDASNTPPHTLNQVLELLWPDISSFLVEQVVDHLEPALERALPPSLKGQLTIDTAGLYFGENPLNFLNVTTSKEFRRTHRGMMESIRIHVDFVWEGECTFNMIAFGASLGIQGIYMKGTLAVELMGIVYSPPFFMGVSVYMMNSPEVDLELNGAVSNLSIVRRSVIGAIKDAISHSVVLPNRVGVPLAPGADIFQIKTPPPEGILKIIVHSADGLPAADMYWTEDASSDPYFYIHCGAEVFRSETKSKTLDPVYELSRHIFIYDAAHQRIDISFFDEDVLKDDDFLASVSIPVADMMCWGRRAHSLPLKDADGNRAGHVSVSAEFQRLVPNCDSSGGPCLIFASIHSAKNVKNAGDGAVYWVETECTHTVEGGPRPSVQESPRKIGDPDSCPELAGQVAKFRKHLEHLHQKGMLAIEAMEMLTMDNRQLHNYVASPIQRAQTGISAEYLHIHWDKQVEFLVGKPEDAVVTFTMYKQSPERDQEKLGECRFSVADVLKADRFTLTRRQRLHGSSEIQMHLRLQAMMVGESTPEWRAQILHRRTLQMSATASGGSSTPTRREGLYAETPMNETPAPWASGSGGSTRNSERRIREGRSRRSTGSWRMRLFQNFSWRGWRRGTS